MIKLLVFYPSASPPPQGRGRAGLGLVKESLRCYRSLFSLPKSVVFAFR